MMKRMNIPNVAVRGRMIIDGFLESEVESFFNSFEDTIDMFANGVKNNTEIPPEKKSSLLPTKIHQTILPPPPASRSSKFQPHAVKSSSPLIKTFPPTAPPPPANISPPPPPPKIQRSPKTHNLHY